METRDSSLPKQKESHMRSTDCNPSLSEIFDMSADFILKDRITLLNSNNNILESRELRPKQ